MTVFGEHIPDETPVDPSDLVDKRMTTRLEVNLAEARNILLAVVKYMSAKPSPRLAPFDLAWILELHAEMFGNVWTYAGTKRQIDLNIGIPWHQVEVQLEEMLRDLQEWTHWLDLIEQAARLHHRAVAIHPFSGGNGRWSRLLANVWLKQNDHSPTKWPESDMIGHESSIRGEYIDAIKAADEGNFEPLVELHRRFTRADSQSGDAK
ncbi:MAG: mobile mystery protein B [Pirellulaceae bacterium]|jgi:Fic-DOC domain mobile mystery protein B|nr:mobile mystery protein B [Pirellulaceae bacterium]HJN11732.1 mobile mystery protein B [Pirellulaceae bacterium]